MDIIDATPNIERPITLLIDLADVVVSRGLYYMKDATDARNAITNLVKEVTRFRAALNQITYVMKAFQVAQLEFEITARTYVALERAKKTLNNLQITLQNNPSSEPAANSSVREHRSIWPFKRAQTERFTKIMEGVQSELNVTLDNDFW
jgi:hypothetical protein